jgi:S-DNA-T family DNA segregation ATPase FtsK/SpoIIIE
MPKAEPPTPPQDDLRGGDALLQALARMQRFGWDILGILTLALTLITLLGLLLPSLAEGVLIQWWAGWLQLWFGYGSLWIPLAGAVTGLLLLRRNAGSVTVRWERILALEGAALTSLVLLSALGGASFQRGDAGLDGGRIGWALSYLLGQLLKPIGMSAPIWQVILAGGALLIFLIIGMGLTPRLAAWAGQQMIAPAAGEEGEPVNGQAVSVAPIQGGAAARKKRVAVPADLRKRFQSAPEEEPAAAKPVSPRDERLPSLELLVNEQISRPDDRTINEIAYLIEKTLAEFGIPARVAGFRVGPTVTQFAVEPGFMEKAPANEGEANRQKVRVAQIAALHRDLALALSAERLRIEAPVPGRPYVGIEVPNNRSSVVRLRPILEAEAFYRINSPLAIALGRDVSGQPVVADLARMPHLLIAGTTGSGKSVCIAALTACLVMNNTPEDLRLVMIDPKMVELVRFNGLPHLYGRVETDVERILGVLRWTVAEMDRRYKLLEVSHSRDLDSYNRKARRRKGESPLPRIIVLIDELADLMMSAPEQTEPALVRLAQMARATGIHLVVATQRPSTDVVTGLIKANFPARLSFAVASSVDSRVILDAAGAENLLGRGDMLFVPPEVSAPLRAQGVMISDQEVERVITHWQRIYPKEEGEVPPWEAMLKQEAILADRDNLVQEAIKIARQEQRVSASLLQRRLRVGYPRAARLVDELEELGVIGPSQGSGRDREVLLAPEDEDDEAS